MENELVIFHYHLFPGGVTNVVMLSVRAILSYMPEIERVRIVCGSERHLQSLKRHIAGEDGASAERVLFEVLPELFYLSRDAQPGGSELPDIAALKETLMQRYGGAVWWIHNYHLGKNPLFTQALLEIARERRDQRLLLHIHDFPECARFDNLSLLGRFITLPLYPISANVRYAVINNRDLDLLTQAGVPSTQAFLLSNPVPDDNPPEADRSKIRSKLELFFSSRFPSFIPGAPLLFYPVRTIRRKNVLEAGLIARVSDEPANLVVTLPGVSEREAPYSALVQRSFEEGLIPGMWGIGTNLSEAGIGFQELALSSDCVVSSSVQEGFGYLFIDGRRWRKPVFARYLDILEGITEVVDGKSAHFYRELAVPVDDATRQRLSRAYRARAESVSPFLPAAATERLLASIEDAFSREIADFSFLSVDDQRKLLERTSDPGVRSQIAVLNRGPLDALVRLMSRRPEEIGERIRAHFSLETFSMTLRRILEGFASSQSSDRSSNDPSPAEGGDIHTNLLGGFATLDYIRLLYE